YFQEIFHNCGRSRPKLNKKANKKKPSEIYQLVTLGKVVDLWCLLTGYSTSYPPQPGLYDQCKLPFINDNGTVFICSHTYHSTCYHRRCIYCKKFYKKGVVKNIELFLKRIEKSINTFTLEDLVDDDNTKMEIKERDDENSREIDKTLDILSKLIIEINQIENW
ncbi:1583_t:CDS:1, partial [Funneliformis geosporum]